MHVGRFCLAAFLATALAIGFQPEVSAAARKIHTVYLGAPKRVPYSKAGDPSGATAGQDAVSFDLVPGSAVLVEESDEDADAASSKTN
jgi:hypothetical protein